jgi:hypothetical protein
MSRGFLDGATMRILYAIASRHLQAHCSPASAPGSHAAVVGLVQGELVAVANVTPRVNIPLLRANFQVDSILDPQLFPPEEHAELNSCVMNPIFIKRGGAFLAGKDRC